MRGTWLVRNVILTLIPSDLESGYAPNPKRGRHPVSLSVFKHHRLSRRPVVESKDELRGLPGISDDC